VDESRSWKPDARFLEFTHVLLKRGELDPLRGVLADRPDSQDAPLELFAVLLEEFPADLSAKSALANALQGQSAEDREGLIDEFETLARSGTYSDVTVSTIRSALVEQYERWRPTIAESVKQHVFARTEHPAKGAVGRLAGSFFGFMIPAIIVEKIAGTLTAMFLWAVGVVAVVGYGVANRSNIRDERLRKENEEEEKLRSRLDAAAMNKCPMHDLENEDDELQASSATATADSFRRSHPEAETLADFMECPRCNTMIPPSEPRCPKCGWE